MIRLAALFLLLPLTVHANEITLSPGQKLADVLRNASSGDTILVQPGTYGAQSASSKLRDITLRCAGRAWSCIFDGQGSRVR